MKTFGEKIREARTELGITQIELGKRVGVSNRTITAYENGAKKAYERTIRQLAKALGVSAKYLLEDECQDPHDGLEEEKGTPEDRQAEEEFDVRQMLLDNTALFAGGELTQEEKDNYYRAITAAYEACRAAAERKERKK